MSRGHTKSRFGCRECKQRHIKCDESRPSCINCITVRRHCSFVTVTPVTPLPQTQSIATPEFVSSPNRIGQSTSRQELPKDTTTPTPPENTHGQRDVHLSASTPCTTPTCRDSTKDSSLCDDHFTIAHLELLHHYQTVLSPLLVAQQPQSAPMLRYLVSCSMKSPFLMDQVLSMAAAHKHAVATFPEALTSPISAASRSATGVGTDYFLEASALQSRSMRKFHAAREAHGGGDSLFHEAPLAVVAFSMLVSHSALFFACTAATRSYCSSGNVAIAGVSHSSSNTVGFSAVLEEFDSCFMVHSGMADITKQAIPMIDAGLRSELFGFVGQTILVDKVPSGIRSDEVCTSPVPQQASSTDMSQSESYGLSVNMADGGEGQENDALPPVSLLESLLSSSTSTSSLDATYHETIQVLLKEFRSAVAFDSSSRPKAQRYLSATQHFLVRSPAGFRELLAQRRPEALVIFAHYAVLVHRAGEYWGVGRTAGKVLVDGIVGILGGFWRRWLEWPVEQVGRCRV
ncbi:transcriptional activator protein UGA3 [Microdochium nivale]|nr:transcriptional activator protein UGA3 [Microdochium nivale]